MDSFCPESVLLSSTISRLKTLTDTKAMIKAEEHGALFTTTIEALVYRGLSFARQAEQTSGLPQTVLLQELDTTMTHFMGLLSRGTIWAGYHWHAALHFQGELYGDRGSSHQHYSAKTTKTFLSLAVQHGLVLSVGDMLSKRDTHAPHKGSEQRQPQQQQRLLLDFALRPFCSRFGVESSLAIPRVSGMRGVIYACQCPEILASLIQHGADPHATLRRGMTPRKLCEYLFNHLERVEGDR
ncbi:hypothetical protein B0T22DRAFT_475860 [Podospora appendiculata]|uniref:Uncharacterized protein n=1 Tax=Podospora appendiculata TaxID=314037 RepID=A0AAE1CG20_9PEZI|nr:hypothetical protein B0T22DRAFT_475860 [Podospora appendiculata]